MKSKTLPAFERLMIFSAFISFGLLFYRCAFTLTVHYTYFLWNLLVAYIPYIISKYIEKGETVSVKSGLLLSAWLILFPSSIYLLTDILEMHKTDNFSVFYDAILYLSFAWNGLLPALMSLKKVEAFLRRYLSVFWVKFSVLFFIFLSSYATCIVRFLHLKDWHLIDDYKRLIAISTNNFLNPEDHIHAWLSIISLMMLIDLIYLGFKKLYYMKKIDQNLVL